MLTTGTLDETNEEASQVESGKLEKTTQKTAKEEEKSSIKNKIKSLEADLKSAESHAQAARTRVETLIRSTASEAELARKDTKEAQELFKGKRNVSSASLVDVLMLTLDESERTYRRILIQALYRYHTQGSRSET